MRSPISTRLTIEHIRAAMRGPLPGPREQIRMAPQPRTLVPPADSSPRQAGVLLVLYPIGDALHVVLTIRNAHLNYHRGQISLPGGGWEEVDSSYLETALRETCEEIGIAADGLEVLGPLTPLYIPPSNNVVHPFVAYTSQRPAFDPDPAEVASLLEVPLPLLLDPATRREEDWIWRGEPLHVPFYAVDEHKIWGATAIVLAEFLAMVDRKVAEPAAQ